MSEALILLLFVFVFAIIMYVEGSAPPSLQTNSKPFPKYNEKKEESNLISKTKKVEKILQATPQLEHLYCDRDFRIVKTQRESKQRASYTIAIRKA